LKVLEQMPAGNQPELRFDNRVAVVTGAGKGLGRAYALLLAARGAAVVVNNPVRGSEPLGNSAQQVVDEIRALGGRAVADPHSVSTEEGGEGIIRTALDAFGTVDIVVNNAGIVRDKTFAKLSRQQITDVLDVHVMGAFHVTAPAFRVMREHGYGRVVSTSSATGLFGSFGQANYGAAKMAIVGLTKVLAVEGKKYGIKANVVAPIARTAMTAGVLEEEMDALADPELVAPAVAYLAHERCPSSGDTFSVGAGRVARVFLGECRGFYDPWLTIEHVANNWSQICSEEGYAVPADATDERRLFHDALRHDSSDRTLGFRVGTGLLQADAFT
jgi:NAD(P)-dependent dehydrogenase (short-subunit alcohol dehydrogenase family)